MAQATRLPKTVTVFTGVELTLTEIEADTLFKVCANIGGNEVDSPRRHTDAIRRALYNAGYRPSLSIKTDGGSIYFERDQA